MSIRVESVSYTYMEDTPLSHTALHELSLAIPDGSFTAIAGETGAGHTDADHGGARHADEGQRVC